MATLLVVKKVPLMSSKDLHSFVGDGYMLGIQGYLAHKKRPPPRTLRHDYVQGHMVALGRGGVSHERGNPVLVSIKEPCGVW